MLLLSEAAASAKNKPQKTLAISNSEAHSTIYLVSQIYAV